MSVESGVYEPEPKDLSRRSVVVDGNGNSPTRESSSSETSWGSLLGPSVWGSGGVESWILSPLHLLSFFARKSVEPQY